MRYFVLSNRTHKAFEHNVKYAKVNVNADGSWWIGSPFTKYNKKVITNAVCGVNEKTARQGKTVWFLRKGI